MDLLALTIFAFGLPDWFAHFCRDLLTIIIFTDIILEKYGTDSCSVEDHGGFALNICRQVRNYFTISDHTFLVFPFEDLHMDFNMLYVCCCVTVCSTCLDFGGLDLISAAKESIGYNKIIKFAIDVATTNFYVGKLKSSAFPVQGLCKC